MMLSSQFILPIAEEIVVDLFAGGGRTSATPSRCLVPHDHPPTPPIHRTTV